ncbi:hypothetical protein QOL99_02945 [Deinococcus sp. MIMF12]|uniref:Uncharacterized protein n=1 Tax=Deinococcus rhizophilus TaxID=3049544 RepID=A0ABT7JDI6_9DEIO|nr:hypothetical protein [Deinococcus rhizophilus]MDL2343102.1 hypothetical protein [Deinococcus rhizophilus]
MRARGKLARLEALEAREAARREEVGAANGAHIEAAEARLSPEDRAAWRDASRGLEDPDTVARLTRACAHLPEGVPFPHPAKEEAEAWADVALDQPDGCPLLAPPAGRAADFAAYFGACGAWCDGEARRVPLSADVHRLARWGAALWRLWAALALTLGDA